MTGAAAGANLTGRRSYWLTLPYAAYAGYEELLGQLHGFGPVTTAQAHDLVPHARRWVATRDQNGHVLLHGELHLDGHPQQQEIRVRNAVREVDLVPPPEEGYRPSARLQAKVRARDGTCRAPSCSRSAWNADLDHTRPYHQGGPTAYDNLAALHRRHHRIKGTVPGVRVQQIRPGYLVWRTRTGDLYHMS